MKKKISIKDIHTRVLEAFTKVADPVSVTFGPGGRNVLLTDTGGAPTITKDGVTVSKSIYTDDEELNLIISIIKEAGDKTNREAGDGTTSATILASEIFKEGAKLVAAGHRPVKLQREILTGIQRVVSKLKEKASLVPEDDEGKLSTLKKIAKISMNGDDKVANIVGETVFKTGPDGTITTKRSNTTQDKWHVEKGLKIDKGWFSPSFKKDENVDKITFEKPYILITSHDLYNSAQLQGLEGILNPLIKSRRPIVIISSGVGGEFLANLVANAKTGRLQCCPIMPPYFGIVRREFFRDLAALTGGRVIDKDEGDQLEAVEIEHLGEADLIEITARETVIIGGKGDSKAVDERKQYLRDRSKTEEYRDLDKIRERLAKLSGGIGIIELYCYSDVELQEKQFRVEDAAHACKAALTDGYVSGGGAALYRSASEALDTSIAGEKVILNACANLIKILASNIGESGEVIANTLKENPDDTAVNLLTGTIENAIDSGIIDPLKVVKVSLVNGGSVAATLLTTGAIISDIPERNPLEAYNPY